MTKLKKREGQTLGDALQRSAADLRWYTDGGALMRDRLLANHVDSELSEVKARLSALEKRPPGLSWGDTPPTNILAGSGDPMLGATSSPGGAADEHKQNPQEEPQPEPSQISSEGEVETAEHDHVALSWGARGITVDRGWSAEEALSMPSGTWNVLTVDKLRKRLEKLAAEWEARGVHSDTESRGIAKCGRELRQALTAGGTGGGKGD